MRFFMNKTESVAARLKYIMNQRGLKQVDVLNLARPYCEKYNNKGTIRPESISFLLFRLIYSPALLI